MSLAVVGAPGHTAAAEGCHTKGRRRCSLNTTQQPRPGKTQSFPPGVLTGTQRGAHRRAGPIHYKGDSLGLTHDDCVFSAFGIPLLVTACQPFLLLSHAQPVGRQLPPTTAPSSVYSTVVCPGLPSHTPALSPHPSLCLPLLPGEGGGKLPASCLRSRSADCGSVMLSPDVISTG